MSTEHPVREGSTPNDGPVDGLPGPSAEIEAEAAPSGLPEDAREDAPLGSDAPADPDGEGDPARGDDAMPGIPAGDEPPSAG